MTEDVKPGDTGTPQGKDVQPDKAGQQPPEIDFERIKAGDEEYTKEVNRQLGVEQPAEDQGSVDEGGKEGKSELDAGKTTDEFFSFEDGDPVYHGEPFKVRKQELKSLVQKGRHMDETLAQVAPLRKVAKEIPALAEILDAAARDPELLRSLAKDVEKIKRGAKIVEAEEEDDLSDLEVEGLDEDDVRNMAKVNKAIEERKRRREEAREEEGERALQEEMKRREFAARSYVSALRTAEGDTFEKVRPYMKELMSEAERESAPEVFAQFKEAVLNPFATDADGNPLFHHFYAEAKSRYLKSQGRGSARGVKLQDPPTSSTRLSPGSRETDGGSRSSGGDGVDWENLSQQEFDRRMNEALAKAK